MYILYASGEILLVIIGIIIALQIDNWNENRKESNLELQLYSNLLEDLGNKNFNIESHIDRFNQYDELNFHIYNETNGEAQYNPNLYYNLLISYHRYNMFITDKYQVKYNLAKRLAYTDHCLYNKPGIMGYLI